MARKLAVFDFDHTIIDDNSDSAVVALVGKSKISKEIMDLRSSEGWTAFMQGVFNVLHKHHKTQEMIASLIKNLRPVTGMCHLINELIRFNYDVIIISDSNSYFIDVWLKANNLHGKILKVFTNPAKFVDGKLTISMYHLQDYCKLSTKNLCKGQILEDFVSEQKVKGIDYNQIVYCGDGSNDFCPILRLRGGDLACVRDGYKCAELVKKAKNGELVDDLGRARVVEARVVVWKDGRDILGKLDES